MTTPKQRVKGSWQHGCTYHWVTKRKPRTKHVSVLVRFVGRNRRTAKSP